jgi:hypothetical protein
MKFADLIREFCEGRDEYDVYENYSGRFMFGKLCQGIVVRQGYSHISMMYELTQFLDEHDYEDEDLNMEGIAVDSLGLSTIVYFPHMRDYEYKAKTE